MVSFLSVKQKSNSKQYFVIYPWYSFLLRRSVDLRFRAEVGRYCKSNCHEGARNRSYLIEPYTVRDLKIINCSQLNLIRKTTYRKPIPTYTTEVSKVRLLRVVNNFFKNIFFLLLSYPFSCFFHLNLGQSRMNDPFLLLN